MLQLEGLARVISQQEDEITVETQTPRATADGAIRSGYEVLFESVNVQTSVTKLILRKGDK